MLSSILVTIVQSFLNPYEKNFVTRKETYRRQGRDNLSLVVKPKRQSRLLYSRDWQ